MAAEERGAVLLDRRRRRGDDSPTDHTCERVHAGQDAVAEAATSKTRPQRTCSPEISRAAAADHPVEAPAATADDRRDRALHAIMH